ncbi:unnamed protein product [Cyprideis torosa]|uniref:Uncharacterized protein n=1 Tax=Cyprideis torosa TaxID=163714 RepID=A0A7R9A0S2_9CRUS|nr:unnamed protein product [Cyprideis torosa]CAG0911093.1 unnamed protein product [Cyprideis torosa]
MAEIRRRRCNRVPDGPRRGDETTVLRGGVCRRGIRSHVQEDEFSSPEALVECLHLVLRSNGRDRGSPSHGAL